MAPGRPEIRSGCGETGVFTRKGEFDFTKRGGAAKWGDCAARSRDFEGEPYVCKYAAYRRAAHGPEFFQRSRPRASSFLHRARGKFPYLVVPASQWAFYITTSIRETELMRICPYRPRRGEGRRHIQILLMSDHAFLRQTTQSSRMEDMVTKAAGRNSRAGKIVIGGPSLYG